jgi:hypothetical protein
VPHKIDTLCVKPRALFSDHLDGQRIPFWRGLLVRWHLWVCPRCKLVNRSLEATKDALGALRDSEL